MYTFKYKKQDCPACYSKKTFTVLTAISTKNIKERYITGGSCSYCGIQDDIVLPANVSVEFLRYLNINIEKTTNVQSVVNQINDITL